MQSLGDSARQARQLSAKAKEALLLLHSAREPNGSDDEPSTTVPLTELADLLRDIVQLANSLKWDLQIRAESESRHLPRWQRLRDDASASSRRTEWTYLVDKDRKGRLCLQEIRRDRESPLSCHTDTYDLLAASIAQIPPGDAFKLSELLERLPASSGHSEFQIRIAMRFFVQHNLLKHVQARYIHKSEDFAAEAKTLWTQKQRPDLEVPAETRRPERPIRKKTSG